MKTIEQAREWLRGEVKRREIELFAYSKALELAEKNHYTGFLLSALHYNEEMQQGKHIKEAFLDIIEEVRR